MGIRKRKWGKPDPATGEQKWKWVVDYATTERDEKTGRLKRHIKTFDRRKDAETWQAETFVNVKKGVHTPASKSVNVQKAGENWIESCDDLERSTVDQYQQHLKFHIVPFLGQIKLSALTAPIVHDWQSKLRKAAEPRSPAMVRKVTTSLSSLLADAMRRGHVAQNVVRSMTTRRRGKVERRANGKLKVGADIPEPAEIDLLLQHTTDARWRAFLLVAVRCGLRSSELRGLRWSDIDFRKNNLHVRQRADRYNEIGNPKSEDSERTVRILPATVTALKAWKLQCPKGELGLVFPNGSGNVETHSNIVDRGLIPAWERAGVTVPVLDDNGKPTRDEEGRPIVEAKYTGLHSLRHYFASWCINRRADGGLELPLKVVSEWLGHSNISITADRYGHLFPRQDDSAELAKAEGKFG